MDGKLLYGAGGNLLPKRLIDGYQDAVFAWSGDYPYANIAQSNIYSISSGTSHNNDWLVKTPYGKGFRAPSYSSSGWIETPSTGTFGEIYSGGITIYCKFVLESQPSGSQFPSYFGLFDKGNGSYYGGIVLGVEYGGASKQRHMFRVGNSATIRYFNNDPAGLNVPVGTLIQAAVTFNPDSRKYTSVYQYKDALHVYSGTSSEGLFMSYGTIIKVGGYNRSGNRASQTTSVLEAALWNRFVTEKDLLHLIGRQSIYREHTSGLILFGRSDGYTAKGTCTSTSTVMANGIGSDGSEPEGWAPVKISNGAESSSGFNHYTIDNTNNMDMLLWVYYASNMSGSLPDDFEISAKINTLPITLTKTSITPYTEGWLTFEIPPEVKEVDVHGRITHLKYFYTTHLTKDNKDITYDKGWQTVMDLTVSNGGTETATAAINGTSSLVGISIYHATEPTTPCVVYIETSTDSGSTYTPYKATYGVTNAAYTVTDMIRLPAGTTNVKAIATDNTGLSATVKVIVGVIKGMKEVI